ncbi:MAG: UDP-glucose 4-epimerase GalE [Pseudomonadota bacterium]|nr:UDP-glucose 4-epimerase GalE [Pseudomonadota bacterium]
MRVLVTGGAGYIGSVVAEQLVARRDHVVVYDNLVTGHRRAVPPGARLVEGDIGDVPTLRRTLREEGIDAVVHMAAVSLVGVSVQDPAAYYRNNVTAGLAMLDAMLAEGVRRIVFSSSASVYGEPVRQPIQEEDPTRPTSPYGATKLVFEDILRWYGGAYGLRSVGLRYFNAAGASARAGEDHEPETHLIPRLLQLALGVGEPIAVFGQDYPTRDGTGVRDYVHVLDLADAHIAALDAMVAETRGGGGESRVYNLGCGGEGYSVQEVVDAARSVTGHPIPVTIGPRRSGDPAVLVASSDRIRAELGWRPRHQDLGAIIGSAWRWALANPRGWDDRGR